MKKEEPKEVIKEPSKYSFWAILIAFILAALGVVLIWRWLFQPNQAEAKPEPACKTENAECKTNDSNKLCCEGLVCMDKDVPAETGKCKVAPTPTATPTPTITPTPPVCPTWSCGECEELYSQEPNGLLTVKPPACMDEKKYCEETYSCKWVCPTEDKCKKEDKIWSCDCPPEPTPTPTPEVTPEPTKEPVKEESKPEGCTHDCPLPACTDSTPQPVTNPHVYRNGDCAIVKYWPSSDMVNLYWKEVSAGDWQHALANQPATGNHEICGLTGDVTFGVQSVSGCAADGIVNASTISSIVDGDTSAWILFR